MKRGQELGIDEVVASRRQAFKEALLGIRAHYDKLHPQPREGMWSRLRRTPKTQPDLVNFHWPQELCLATKRLIEEKPAGIDTTKLIKDTYQRLVGLLGEPDRKMSVRELGSRIMFVDSEILMAFRHFIDHPDEDHDTYWRNPSNRIYEAQGRDFYKALKTVTTGAVTYLKAGVVMLPNDVSIREGKEDEEVMRYRRSSGISDLEAPKVIMKRKLAHELVHFLYGEKMSYFPILEEQIVDYIATEVYPEATGLHVQLAWARASVGDYLQRVDKRSITDLFTTSVDLLGTRDFFDKQMEVHEKYFSDFPYMLFVMSEEMLRGKGLSKFRPLPK